MMDNLTFVEFKLAMDKFKPIPYTGVLTLDIDSMQSVSYLKSVFIGNDERELNNRLDFIFKTFDNTFRSLNRYYKFMASESDVINRDIMIMEEYNTFNFCLDKDFMEYIIKDDLKSRPIYHIMSDGIFVRLVYANTLLCIINNTSKDQDVKDSIIDMIKDLDYRNSCSIILNYRLNYLTDIIGKEDE